MWKSGGMTTHIIALVAHDHKKDLLIEWAKNNKEVLGRHSLVATGTTGRMLNELVGLNVRCLKSGPLGGDQQLGAMICELQVDILIFFWDPLEPQPHDPDVRALLRIAVVYDIPTASNLSTADCLMSSPLFAD
ncbi:MAG: methylglyoxal synthase [Actinomycetota bacterium]|nr:methylglyoxal synthase [Actinomycetota bacterium]MDA3019391.1 methylglyoxal synthase [Actinomycetota bacterium]